VKNISHYVVREVQIVKFAEHIEQLVKEGYKKTSLVEQISKDCGLKSKRAVWNWLSGSSVPDVYRAQMVAAYLTKKLGRKVTITDIWPVDGLREVV
jgi:hypothetical protein